jgi:hypothetical protein
VAASSGVTEDRRRHGAANIDVEAGPDVFVIHAGKAEQSLADAAIERAALLDVVQGLGLRRMAVRKKQGQQRDDGEDDGSFLETAHFDPAIGDARWRQVLQQR